MKEQPVSFRRAFDRSKADLEAQKIATKFAALLDQDRFNRYCRIYQFNSTTEAIISMVRLEQELQLAGFAQIAYREKFWSWGQSKEFQLIRPNETQKLMILNTDKLSQAVIHIERNDATVRVRFKETEIA